MKKRLKVLQVLEATVGGTRRHVVSILAGIDRERFEVEVAAPAVRYGGVTDDSFLAEVTDLGVPFHMVDLRREIHPWVDLQSIMALYRLMRSNDYDVIHLHSSKAGFVGRLAAKLNGIPTVYTPNGFYFLQADQANWKNSFFLGLERIAGFATDCLIAVSQSEYEAALKAKLVSSSKLRVIPNAICYEDFQPDPAPAYQMRVKLGLSPQQFVVGVISRYIPQKDPYTIIEVAAKVFEHQPNVVFVWCGEGEMRSAVEQRTRDLGIHDKFLFLGFRKDVLSIMQAFDLFLLASIFEGLPYTLLETMSMGIPIVATEVVGTKDVVTHGETGLLVPPKRADLLASAVLDLISDPDQRKRLGDSARTMIHSKFNVETMVRNIESVYWALSTQHSVAGLTR